MNDELETRLRRTPLTTPAPEARARLLGQAHRRRGAMRRGNMLRWALAAIVVALLLINVAFERSHTQRMIALTGPQPQVVISAAQYAEAMRQTNEMLSQMLEMDGQL